MANKRMFSKDVTCTDRFLELPISAQGLYFHIGMNADDDGFLDNPKSLTRMVGAKAEDLNKLINERFIRLFDSGVVAITDWKKNNVIRKDRYVPTVYRREKATLEGADVIEEVALEEPEEDIRETVNDGLSEEAETNQYVDIYLGLSPGNMEELRSFREDGLPEALIRKAVDKSMASRAKNWNYAKRIMNDWVSKGYKTVAEIEAADAEWFEAKKAKANPAAHGYQEHKYSEADFGDEFYYNPDRDFLEANKQ